MRGAEVQVYREPGDRSYWPELVIGVWDAGRLEFEGKWRRSLPSQANVGQTASISATTAPGSGIRPRSVGTSMSGRRIVVRWTKGLAGPRSVEGVVVVKSKLPVPEWV